MSEKESKHIASGAKTNETKGSLVKVVVKEKTNSWKQPDENAIFYIDDEAKFPEVLFEIDSDVTEEYTWTWSIAWAASTSGLRESTRRGRTIKQWSEKGKISSSRKSWTADLNGKCLGGTLTVSVKAKTNTYRRSVRILGTNPSEEQISKYISTFDEIPGFERLIAQESKYKNFINADREPVVAFDGGYGLTQLTNPKPTYVEAWNWKENIRAGIALYHTKRQEAKNYLSGGKNGKRDFTEKQLELETWCRWNSGRYHDWDEKEKKWIRNPTILNDNETANIGWDMTKPQNKGKTEKELHERDKKDYANPPTSNSLWRYSGVVYADHIDKE